MGALGGVSIPELYLQNVTKIFGSNAYEALKLLDQGLTKEEVEARTRTTVGVYRASFQVERGQTFVIMGLSGSGKSTLLRCINRIHEPTAGKIHIGDTEITALRRNDLQSVRRKKVAMVFQRFALFPHRSVAENVAYGLEVQGVPKQERLEKAHEVLSLVGLEGWADRRPDELSGGMQQRVGIARALAVDPDILLMDEAFSALDPLIRKEMQDELISLQERMQKTIVFVTHDLDEALKLGDQIAVMRAGRIEQIGTPEQIISQPATDYVASFTAGVDRSRVLTAGSVMKPAEPVLRQNHGPKTALDRMRRYGISGMFMVGPNGRLLGYLSADAAKEGASRGEELAEPLLDTNVATVHIDASLKDAIAAGNGKAWPLAVVDDEYRLRGVLVKGAILGALADDDISHTQRDSAEGGDDYAAV